MRFAVVMAIFAALTVTSQEAVGQPEAVFINNNLKYTVEFPSPLATSVTPSKPPKRTKVVFRVYSNTTDFMSHRPGVHMHGFNFIRTQHQKGSGFIIIFNSCTNANTPDWKCREIQVAIEKRLNVSELIFELYQHRNGVPGHGVFPFLHLATINLTGSLEPTDTELTVTTVNDSIVTTDIYRGRFNSQTGAEIFRLNTTLSLILITALVVAVLMIFVLVFVIIYQHRRSKMPKQPASGNEV